MESETMSTEPSSTETVVSENKPTELTSTEPSSTETVVSENNPTEPSSTESVVSENKPTEPVRQLAEHITADGKVYKEGDFSFVDNRLHRYMLTDIYTALEKSKLWDFIKNESIKAETYLENPEVLILFLHMKYKSHTIETFGIIIRNMRKIAKDGWDEYVREWLATEKKE